MQPFPVAGGPRERMIGRILRCALLLPALAACRSNDIDPQSTTIVYGDHTTIANCFVKGTQAFITGLSTDAAGNQSITMTVGPAGLSPYRVIFTDQPDNKTKVSGYPIGTVQIPFYWFSYVRPVVRICAGQLDVR